MKIVILAGGRGTRLSEYTNEVPKPMVEIGDKPILGHIIDIFLSQGLQDIIIAAGYKKEVIEEWAESQDFGLGARVRVFDTGLDTQTGGRLGRLRGHLQSGPFLVTYGDGVANVNISYLWNLHTSVKPLVTITAVRPPARFGSLRLGCGAKVLGFHEKSQTLEGWINGGFMIVEPPALKLIKGDQTNWERDVLPDIAASGEMVAYQHVGFWQCMDTLRDVELLRELYKKGAPWTKKFDASQLLEPRDSLEAR